MADQFPMLSLTPDVPDPVAPSAAPAQSIQQQPAAPASTTAEPLAVPTAAAAQPQASAQATAPRLDQSQLTPAERTAIEDFLTKLDITNPDHVLLFGADAQKHISDFSESALQAARTSDTGEVGKMLENLVVELKGFEADAEEPKGIFKIFHSADNRIERMKARYNKANVNVENIATSLEGYQAQLLKDVAMFDRLYDQNTAYFRQLTLYIIAGEEKLQRVREGELEELMAKAAESGDAMDAQKANDLAAQCDRFEKKAARPEADPSGIHADGAADSPFAEQ